MIVKVFFSYTEADFQASQMVFLLIEMPTLFLLFGISFPFSELLF